MAGLNKPTINMDPALVKYNNMMVNRHKYFRWTPRTAWITIVYAMIIPAGFAYVGYRTEGKYDMRGKLRGDTVAEF